MILTVTVIDSTGITISGEQTEISVVNPATSVTFNPSQSFSSTNVQDALFESHKMVGYQSNNYSVTLDYGNKFEIQSGSNYARFDVDFGSGGWFADIKSSDKMRFTTGGNLNASLDSSGSTFYDKLEVEGSNSIVDGIIQTNNTSGDTRHHFQMRSSGSSKGFLGTTSTQVLLGRSSTSVAYSADAFGGSFAPSTQFGGSRDGFIDLGKDDSRFRDLYLSDNLYADGVSFEDANITFTTDQFTVDNASNNNLISTTSQGVNLKYNGVQRLATTNSGVSISGGLDATTGNIANLNTSGTLSAGNVVVSGSVAVAGTVDGRDLSVDGDKLDNIESNATADQTDAEIRAAVDAATDSNVYTDAEKTKLTSIETGATADQTDAEIRSAVASATDSNVFTDSEKTKLSGAAELDSSPTFTGTVSSTGLAVDTDTLYVDEANDRVGINTSSPDYNLVVADTGTSTVQIKAGNANYSQLNFGDTDDNDIGQIAYIHDSNKMRFTSNNSQAMVIDSSGKVGIGTDSPDRQLTIANLTGSADMSFISGNAGNALIYFADTDDDNIGAIGYNHASNFMNFRTNDEERMRITSSGKVGIGTSSPSATLDVTAGNIVAGGKAVAISGNTSYIADGSYGTSLDITHNYQSNDGSFRAINIDLTDSGTNNQSLYGLYVNAEYNYLSGYVGIGTTSPDRPLDITDGTNDGTGGVVIHSYLPTLELDDMSGGGTSFILQHDSADTLFKHGTTERMRIDSSGKVGIGTSSPAYPLDIEAYTAQARIHSTVGNSVLRLDSVDDGESKIYFADNSAAAIGTIEYHHNTNHMSFATGATTRMLINSSGNVGIGTSSPSEKLHVQDSTGSPQIRIDNQGTASGIASLLFRSGGAGNPSSIIQSGGTSSGNQGIVFKHGDFGAEVERMRIDSSGNLLVGTTNANNVSDGIRLKPDGFISAANTSSPVMYANRLSTDGSIISLQKDGTTVGSIGTETGRLTIGSGDTGLRLLGDTDEITPWNTSTNAGRNALIDLGNTNNRFKDLYLSGGVHLGGTGSANKLDDYEEGVWTPTIYGSTSGQITGFNISSARYTKVGRLVTIQTYISAINDANDSMVGEVYMGGLPYNCNTGFTPISTAYANMFTDSADRGVSGYIQSGTNYIKFTRGSNTARMTTADRSTGNTNIMVTATYMTS